MNTTCRIILPGLLTLVVSGTALAHVPGHHGGYRDDGWYGNATLWLDSTGHSGWAGNFGYRTGYGYPPGYSPWAGHLHGPRCQHGSGHGYAHGYRHGFKHGRKHGRKHRHHH